MRVHVEVHEPTPTTHLPAHERAARRKRVTTERPAATPKHNPNPTPPAPLGRKSADTRFLQPRGH